MSGPAAKLIFILSAEAFVERRFEIGETLATAEGLRAGDKDELVFFFAPAISDSRVSGAKHANAVRSANASGGKRNRDDKFTQRLHDVRHSLIQLSI